MASVGQYKGKGMTQNETIGCPFLRQQSFPNTTILENFGLRGTTARDGVQARPQVRAWIEQISLLKTD